MANEKRLIDVNKVINSMQKCLDESPDKKHSVGYFAFESIIECLKQEPTVDAVPVVRCRECKFGVTPYGDEHDGWIECSNIHSRPLFGCNDFCSYGERKEGTDNG